MVKKAAINIMFNSVYIKRYQNNNNKLYNQIHFNFIYFNHSASIY